MREAASALRDAPTVPKLERLLAAHAQGIADPRQRAMLVEIWRSTGAPIPMPWEQVLAAVVHEIAATLAVYRDEASGGEHREAWQKLEVDVWSSGFAFTDFWVQPHLLGALKEVASEHADPDDPARWVSSAGGPREAALEILRRALPNDLRPASSRTFFGRRVAASADTLSHAYVVRLRDVIRWDDAAAAARERAQAAT